VAATENKDSYKSLISEWDAFIRQGQLHRAADQIRKFNFQQIPRESRTALANVCRRAGLIGHGLKVLQPLVRQLGPSVDKPATQEETCEYAALLMRNGSLAEAMNLLAGIDGERLPLSLLYRGFCHVSSWDYEAAAPLFEALLKSEIDDYSKLIALVNLGASLSAIDRRQEAMEIINRAIVAATKVQAQRLIGNCLEIRAQIYMSQNAFAEAKKDLRQAHEMFDKNKNYDLLLISKNLAFIQALEEKSLEPIHKFKAEAMARKHWESVREADFFSLKIRFDQKLFDHLIVGSPLPGYRKRALKQLPHEPSDYCLLGKEGSRCLDLENGHSNSDTGLNPGKKVHAVLAALVADFYAPRNSGSLFANLYPDEYFDIGSSPNRVRQAIYRARSWLSEQDIPAEIHQDDGDYRFEIQGDFSLRISYAKPDLQSEAIRFLEMKKALPPGQPFTIGDACALLNISRSTFHRLAEYGLKNGLLRRVGVKRSTSYVLEP